MKRTLTLQEQKALLQVLEVRFDKNMVRHKGLKWTSIATRLSAMPEKVWSLHEMERTGGEPDVVGMDKGTGEFLFYDCSSESPKGRRSLCYDQAALESRKENKPSGSVLGMAAEMGIELLTESNYRDLQRLGIFDSKTSSWIFTPAPIRNLGGALFGDFRFGQVFTYHNGAESYYAARGFRGCLSV